MWSKFAFLRWVMRFRSEPVKGRTVRRAALRVEGLEERTVPAASSFTDPIALAAQQDFNGPMANAGYDLSYLYEDYLSFTATSGLSASSYQPTNSLLQVSNGSVVVQVLPQSDLNAMRSSLDSLGFQESSESTYVLSGTLPITSLEAAAMLPSVNAIEPGYAPIVNVGATTSQGLKAEQSDKVNNYLGLDGTGVTVGVISDSFNAVAKPVLPVPGSTTLTGAAADIATGDLPGPGNPLGHTVPVNVINNVDNPNGSDEGRAMLQIVHDVAPGANLAFAVAGTTQTDFSKSMNDLATLGGAKVITDDITFLTEPMFQDGLLAQTVDNLNKLGIAYFAAAGNSGSASYEQGFRSSGTDLASATPGAYQVPSALSATFIAHNFDPTPGNTDLFQTITIPPGTTSFSFQWSNPYASINGPGNGATTDMNIAAFDKNGMFLGGSFDKNVVTGDPVEVFSINNPSKTDSMIVQLAIGKNGNGPDPALMKYVAFGSSAGTVTVNEFATNSSTIFGHANAATAETIGAANYAQTPPYSGNPPVLETFSSRGGTSILFGADGKLLPVPQTRQSPDLVAPDGVNTTFFGQPDPTDGFPNFFGTSAAAPHAAGVAALLIQAKPSLVAGTPAPLYTALETTAIDMGTPGYDADSGFGLINATAAVISLNAGKYAVTFNGTSGNDSMLVRRDASGNKLEFLLGGTVQLSIPASQVASIAVNGLGGDDALTIDTTNGAIDRSVAYDGGTGNDSFVVIGSNGFPGDLNVFSDAAMTPTVTVLSTLPTSPLTYSPPLTFKSVEAATLTPADGVVNLIGDNNGLFGQSDSFAVRGTGSEAFTASLNASPPIQFLGTTVLNVNGKTMSDTLTVSPWASNSPAGWGVQTSFDGGGSIDGDHLVYNTVAANPVSENIAVQPATVGGGEMRVTNAIDGSVISIISYANTDLAVYDNDGFSTDTDSLTLRGTTSAEDFVVDLTAAGTAQSPKVDVRQQGGTPTSLYRLRDFAGFSTLGIVGLGGNDTVDLVSGRNDGAVSLNVDLGPQSGPDPTGRVQVYGTDNASDLYRYSPGANSSSGHIEITRANATASTVIDFANVETVGFNGGQPNSVNSPGADRVVLVGTNGNDDFSLVSGVFANATGQVDSGPLLDFTNLGSTGSNFTLDGLDGNDAFSVAQNTLWNIAGVSIDGGTTGTDSATILGSSGDDLFTYTPSTTTLGVQTPMGSAQIPYLFSNIAAILVDALGQIGGDRLVVTEPVGYTPTPNSGTFPTNPPLSYRNFENFTVDQLPTPSDDIATTNEDTSTLIDVLANDTGIGDGPLTVTIAVPPSHGTAMVVNNKILYTPYADYNDLAAGPDSFTYRVTDADGPIESATANVLVHITPVNDPPIALSQSVLGTEDQSVQFTLMADDGDPEVVQTLTYAIVSSPTHGAITAFDPSTGIGTYLPNSNFAGTDTFTFEATDDATAGGPALTSSPAAFSVIVRGVNDPPTAFPQNLATPEDTGLSFTLTGDDGDPEVVQTLTFAIASGPNHGSISGFNAATGKGTYTPSHNYNGPDSFTVTVTDDTTAGGAAITSSPATISINVTPVNDPPVANSQPVSGLEDSSFDIFLTGDDGDPEVTQKLTYAILDEPQNGQIIAFDPSTGEATYQPDPNFAGTDSFTFTVTDDNTAGGPARTSSPGTVSLTVQPVNDPPAAFPQSVSTAEDTPLAIALIADDGDPEVIQQLTYAIVNAPLHGTITSFNTATGHLTYTPGADYNGSDSFSFKVTDDGTAGGPALTSTPATVAIAISPVNDPPIAAPQSVTVEGNGSVLITLGGDDGDPEVNQALSFAISSNPAHGTLAPVAGGLQYVYHPKPGFVGADSFTFTATDNGSPPATSTPATVSLTVTAPPDGIIATGAGDGGGPHVKVFDAWTGVQLASFFAYDPSFRGGVRVAVGDVNGDGVPDIITGAGVGGFPHVKVFDGKTFQEIASFYAFDDAFMGGVSVASGDVDGLPGDEIVVGAGPGAGPHVRTFKLVNGVIEQLSGALGSFYAYDPNFTGGVNVAVGNFDGLPGDEIITGAASLGGPHVKVFASNGTVLASFFAFDNNTLGVSVAAADLDGDGKAEIITGPGDGGGPIPRVFAGGTASLQGEFAAFDPDFRGGIFVGAVDVDGDGISDLLVAPGQSARSIQIFNGVTLALTKEFDAYDSDFAGGVFVAGK